jgi:hypothetical protein
MAVSECFQAFFSAPIFLPHSGDSHKPKNIVSSESSATEGLVVQSI